MSYEFNGMTVSTRMIDAIDDYIANKREHGGFLTAVLRNDLVEAVGRADDQNLHIIPAIVAYLYNEAPSRCWGSPERVDAWLADA
jgi:hypothetical protein